MKRIWIARGLLLAALTCAGCTNDYRSLNEARQKVEQDRARIDRRLLDIMSDPHRSAEEREAARGELRLSDEIREESDARFRRQMESPSPRRDYSMPIQEPIYYPPAQMPMPSMPPMPDYPLRVASPPPPPEPPTIKWIPYQEVAPFMPGIKPDGTSRY